VWIEAIERVRKRNPAFPAEWRRVFDAIIEEAIGEAAAKRSAAPSVDRWCRWTPDEDGVYETTCGQMFQTAAGTPHENNMEYCCYCGRRLVSAAGAPSVDAGEADACPGERCKGRRMELLLVCERCGHMKDPGRQGLSSEQREALDALVSASAEHKRGAIHTRDLGNPCEDCGQPGPSTMRFCERCMIARLAAALRSLLEERQP
jgi:hypothetical protein